MAFSVTLRRSLLLLAALVAAALGSGCAATSVLTFAYEQAHDGQCISAGCAAGAILAYAVEKANEGEPTPCYKLNSVERALTERCGPYQPGSLKPEDVAHSGLPQCPLLLAARDPKLWPVIAELRAKGAAPDACMQSPLIVLAQAHPCPDFSSAALASLESLRWFADTDRRSVHHDVVRMLSCPSARGAGMDKVIDGWLADGRLPTRGLPFGVLGALHPSALHTRLALELEARGHTARAALGAYAGKLPSGFEAALREADFAALDWWLDRVPELVNGVPPSQGDQFPWLPLAKVVTPTYLARPQQQADVVSYLLARGADPRRSLPYDKSQSVLALARQLNSPSVALMDPDLSAPGAAGLAIGASVLSPTAGLLKPN